MMPHLRSLLIPAFIGICMSGCMRLEATWPTYSDLMESEAPESLVARAGKLSQKAVDRQSLLNAIAAHRAVLKRAPRDYETLVTLGNQYVLLGAAYTKDIKEKETYYRLGMQYCEWAMYTNPSFRSQIDSGKAPWEACHVLSGREMGAMLFWPTALLYYFKEVMTWPEKVVNIGLIKYTEPFLKRMEAIDPTWGGGAIPFTWSLYYGILPRAMGGDPALSEDKLEAAVRDGSGGMLSRWGRAKYFHVRDHDRNGFREDLEWVLEQPVPSSQEAPWWRVYFQRDAREMLAQIDRYF